jgi:hypothetical protein
MGVFLLRFYVLQTRIRRRDAGIRYIHLPAAGRFAPVDLAVVGWIQHYYMGVFIKRK